MIKQVCVYCASSAKTPRVYLEAAEKFANTCVDNDIKIVFGGGSTGLMGCLADTVLKRSGKIYGIMPDFMRQVEWAHKELNEIEFVADMHERKKKFLIGTDAIVALPGGSGTLEELLEAITWKRLGLYVNPIVILNLNGFYNPLIEQFERCIEDEFMTNEHRNLWSVVTTPEEILPAINMAPVWENAIQKAKVL